MKLYLEAHARAGQSLAVTAAALALAAPARAQSEAAVSTSAVSAVDSAVNALIDIIKVSCTPLAFTKACHVDVRPSVQQLLSPKALLVCTVLKNNCCVAICRWAQYRCKAYILTSWSVLQAAGSSVKAGVDTATVGLEYAKNVRSPGQATISSSVDSTVAGSSPADAVLALRVRGTKPL